MSELQLVPGVRMRYEPKRAAQGKSAWGVFVDVSLNGERYATTTFRATQAEAEVEYGKAAARLAAEREKAEIDARLTKALAVPPLPQAPRGVILFETMATQWLEHYIKPLKAPGTYNAYGDRLQHLLPIMRTWPVNTETMSVQRLTHVLQEELRLKQVPLKTRMNCQTTLSGFFQWALTQLPPTQLIQNPMLKMGKFVRHTTEADVDLTLEPNPMTHDQAEAFLTWVKDHPRYRVAYEIFLWQIDAGSRIGEIAAMKWDYMDLGPRGSARIKATWSAAQRTREIEDEEKRAAAGEKVVEGCGEKETKTRAKQVIDLSDRLGDAMRELKGRNKEAWLRGGRRFKEPVHSFLTPQSLSPWRPDQLYYDAFHEGCKALELVGQTGEPFTPHKLRHTFTTLAILDGRPIGWVVGMLGHTNESTIRKHYYKWIRQTEGNLLTGRR